MANDRGHSRERKRSDPGRAARPPPRRHRPRAAVPGSAPPGGALRDQPSAVEQRHAVADAEGMVGIVRGEHDGEPRAASRLTSDSTTTWLPKSRLAVGSSMTMAGASCASARAISASWRWPPLMRVYSVSARSAMPSVASAASALRRSSRVGRREQAEMRRAPHHHHVDDAEREMRRVRLRHVGDARARSRRASARPAACRRGAPRRPAPAAGRAWS